MTKHLADYGKVLDIKWKPMADKYHRNNPNSYVQREGETSGVVHLVRCWHGVGRPVSLILIVLGNFVTVFQDLDMVVSKDMIKSGKAFSQTIQLLEELQVFSESMNAFLAHIDPAQHECLKAARALAEEKYPYVKMMDSLDPLLMEGRAIMWNRLMPDHRDHRDPKVAWAAFVVLGHTKSGWLFFQQLNLRVRYQPGDVVWLQGAILDHEVEVWEGEQRISIAQFMHKSYFKDLGLVCVTSPGVVPMNPP